MEFNDNQKRILSARNMTNDANTIESVHPRDIHPKIIHERPLLLPLLNSGDVLNRVCCHHDEYLVYWENYSFQIYMTSLGYLNLRPAVPFTQLCFDRCDVGFTVQFCLFSIPYCLS